MASWGGARPGAGRPVGSKDRLRRTSRLRKLGKLEPVMQQMDVTEFLITSESKVFYGNALDLIKTIYKCEQIPIRIRLYAANKAAEYERPAVSDDNDPAGRVVLYLPDNLRDLSDDDRAAVEKHRRGIVARRDAQLRSWILDGQMTEEQALLARSQWTEPGDAVWTPLQHACDPAEKSRPVELIAPRDPKSHSADQEPEISSLPLPWGEVTPQPATVVLFATPHAAFQAGSGKRYQANELGEVEIADIEDRSDLLRAGCRTSR
jgi:hypothetical protein